MTIYLWLAVGEGEPTLVVACPDPELMEGAIQVYLTQVLGFWPQESCCAAHARDTMEKHLLAHGYQQVITTSTRLMGGPA